MGARVAVSGITGVGFEGDGFDGGSVLPDVGLTDELMVGDIVSMDTGFGAIVVMEEWAIDGIVVR